MRQVFQNDNENALKTFIRRVGTPLFGLGQKLATETFPSIGATIMPRKMSKGLTGIATMGVGGAVALATGITALQTPLNMFVLISMASLTAWPGVILGTLALGAVATVSAFVAAGMAYGGAQNVGLAPSGPKEMAGAAPVQLTGAEGFDPEQDFAGASPGNDNKRFTTVHAPEGKTTFGDGLEAKESFGHAHNGTKPVQPEDKPAVKNATPANKRQFKL